MADHCRFCDTRRPEGGTNILILGKDWLEFCGPCGNSAELTNMETGEKKTLREVFDLNQENRESVEPDQSEKIDRKSPGKGDDSPSPSL